MSWAECHLLREGRGDVVLTAALCGRRTRFATFPQVLVVHAKKFQLVNWVPAKLGMAFPGTCHDSLLTLRVDIPVILPESDELQLDEYLGRGLQPGETELPNDEAGASWNDSVECRNL